MEILEPGRSERLKKKRLTRRVYRVKGPNHIWHCDGHDKLKPYGFAIHGCIDGFSRKLIWLTVDRSNKDPLIVVNYYLESVAKSLIVPSVLRMDKGTENFITGDVQMLLRSNHNDDLATVATMYGPSTHNQRIERFWGSLKDSTLQPYIDLFKDLEACGLLKKADEYSMNCIRFCFMDVLRSELNNTIDSWNSHRIRQTKATDEPSGVPNFLYSVPEYHGYSQMGLPCDMEDVNQCLALYKKPLTDDAFDEWALETMLAKKWSLPKTRYEALDLYGQFIVLQQ